LRKGADSTEKKAQLVRVAPNPPKEEGGGDNAEFGSDYAVAHVATQCIFWHFRHFEYNQLNYLNYHTHCGGERD
jgi:hypothetical protein